MTKPPTCKKVPHTGTGYLHDEDDDSPYDVDGVMYCGRCHFAMDFHRDAPKPKQPTAEPGTESDDGLCDHIVESSVGGFIHEVYAHKHGQCPPAAPSRNEGCGECEICIKCIMAQQAHLSKLTSTIASLRATIERLVAAIDAGDEEGRLRCVADGKGSVCEEIISLPERMCAGCRMRVAAILAARDKEKTDD